MYTTKEFEKIHTNLETRINSLMNGLIEGNKIFKELDISANNQQTKAKKVLSIDSIIEEHIYDACMFFMIHAETCRIMDEFLEDFDNYHNDYTGSWVTVLENLTQLLEPYKKDVIKYLFVEKVITDRAKKENVQSDDLKKDCNIIEERIRILLSWLKSGGEIIKKVEEEKHYKGNFDVTIEDIVTDHITEVIGVYVYFAETYKLMDQFIDDYDYYDDYGDDYKKVTLCVNTLDTIKEFLDQYKDTVINYIFI